MGSDRLAERRSDRLAEKTKRAAAFKTDLQLAGDTSENRVAVLHLADNQCTNQNQQGMTTFWDRPCRHLDPIPD